jgi:hypothetical protein
LLYFAVKRHLSDHPKHTAELRHSSRRSSSPRETDVTADQGFEVIVFVRSLSAPSAPSYITGGLPSTSSSSALAGKHPSPATT